MLIKKRQKTPRIFCVKVVISLVVKKSEYVRHENTLKHKNANNANKKTPKNADFEEIKKFECDDCKSVFKHLSSLSRHRKKCRKNI